MHPHALLQTFLLACSIFVTRATYLQVPANGQGTSDNTNTNNGGNQQRANGYTFLGTGGDNGGQNGDQGSQKQKGSSLPDILFVVPVFEKAKGKVDVNGLSSGYSPLGLSQGTGTSTGGNGQASQVTGYVQSQPTHGNFGYEPTNSGSGTPVNPQGYGSNNGGGQNPQNGYAPAPSPPANPQNRYAPAPSPPTNPQNRYAPPPPPPTNPQNRYAPAPPPPTNPQIRYAPAPPPPTNPQNAYGPAPPPPVNPQNGHAPAPSSSQNGFAPAVSPPINFQNGYAPAPPVPTNPQNGYGRIQIFPVEPNNGIGDGGVPPGHSLQPPSPNPQASYGNALQAQSGNAFPSQPNPYSNNPTPADSGYGMQIPENQFPQDVVVNPYTTAMSSMMTANGFQNTNNQNGMGGYEVRYPAIQPTTQGTSQAGYGSVFMNMMRNQMRRANGYNANNGQQTSSGQTQPAPGFNVSPPKVPTNGNNDDGSEDSNGQRTVIKVALKPILAGGFATKYPEVSYTILKTNGKEEPEEDNQGTNGGYSQLGQGNQRQQQSTEMQQTQGYSNQVQQNQGNPRQMQQNQGYSNQVQQNQGNPRQMQQNQGYPQPIQQNQGYTSFTNGGASQIQQNQGYQQQTPGSTFQASSQASSMSSYGSSSRGSSGSGSSLGDSSMYGQPAPTNVCDSGVDLEGFCNNRKPGLYGHPNPQCFLQCDHTGRHTASMCAPGTMWEQAEVEPSKTNRCVHGSILNQRSY